MTLAEAYDKHSQDLMNRKGEEYSTAGDFLAMENMLAGMTGESPELVSMVMAGKHITSMLILLKKCELDKIDLAKWDERVRDGINLMKIASAFIHARQYDFSLHLGGDPEPSHKVKATHGPGLKCSDPACPMCNLTRLYLFGQDGKVNHEQNS
jgi:hypothetical protein